MILRYFADLRAGALQEAGKVLAGVDAEAYQHQRAKQRQQRLFAGHHHHCRLAELVYGIQRDEATQILHNFNRPAERHRADVGGPEEIAVGGFVDLF